MTPEEEDLLIERCVNAQRIVSPRGERLHKAEFYDLPEGARDEVFARTLVQRRLEAAANERGRSTTVLAVLRAIQKPADRG